jgi:hypothetical protein
VSPDIQVTYQQIATPFPVTYRDVVALRTRKKEPAINTAGTENNSNHECTYFVFSVAINHRAVPKRKNFVRAAGFMGFILHPHIVDNKVHPFLCRAINIMKPNPMGMIPSWIVNMAKKRAALYFINLREYLLQEVVPKRIVESAKYQNGILENNHVVNSRDIIPPPLSTLSFTRPHNHFLHPPDEISTKSSPNIGAFVYSQHHTNDVTDSQTKARVAPISSVNQPSHINSHNDLSQVDTNNNNNKNNNNNNNHVNNYRARVSNDQKANIDGRRGEGNVTNDSDSDIYFDTCENITEIDEQIQLAIQKKIQKELQEQIENERKQMAIKCEALEQQILRLQETMNKTNERIVSLEKDVQLLTAAHAHESTHEGEHVFPLWSGVRRSRNGRSWTVVALAVFWPILLWIVYRFVQSRTRVRRPTLRK